MRVLRQLALFVVYGALGAQLALTVAYIAYLQTRPELKPWHRAVLDAEFRADDAARVRTLDEYRALEARLAAQLREQVYSQVEPSDRSPINRYTAGSRSDPAVRHPDWNYTFELPAADPRGGVLLVHGLSDSPYSMRALAERLHAEGYWAVGLRLPGHGTAPAALTRARWPDWAAAVRIGARHLRERIGAERPLYIVGYSTGAALGVEYALARLAGETLPRVDGLVLLSPAIGVSPAAVLASWQARMGAIPGFEKLAWASLGPEYDPYKYTSFAVNAGAQIYALTREIATRIAALDAGDGVQGMPRVLAFQSAADATVSPEALVRGFLRRLAPQGHELVVFDINRDAMAETLLVPAAGAGVQRLLAAGPLPFALTVVTNRDPQTYEVVARRRGARSLELASEPTGLEWPRGVFSLSHLALPISPADPLYGATRPEPPAGIYLGRPALLGERELLAVPDSDLVRLRFNPFFSYLEQRVVEFARAAPAP